MLKLKPIDNFIVLMINIVKNIKNKGHKLLEIKEIRNKKRDIMEEE